MDRTGNSMISSDLLNILTCPGCGSALREKDGGLQCTECKNLYPVEDGIPVLLVDRAKKIKA
jgi:uncharacterized protein YbaR (Trm112 family)